MLFVGHVLAVLACIVLPRKGSHPLMEKLTMLVATQLDMYKDATKKERKLEEPLGFQRIDHYVENSTISLRSCSHNRLLSKRITTNSNHAKVG